MIPAPNAVPTDLLFCSKAISTNTMTTLMSGRKIKRSQCFSAVSSLMFLKQNFSITRSIKYASRKMI